MRDIDGRFGRRRFRWELITKRRLLSYQHTFEGRKTLPCRHFKVSTVQSCLNISAENINELTTKLGKLTVLTKQTGHFTFDLQFKYFDRVLRIFLCIIIVHLVLLPPSVCSIRSGNVNSRGPPLVLALFANMFQYEIRVTIELF